MIVCPVALSKSIMFIPSGNADQLVVRQQQRVAMLVDGALDQAQYASRWVGLCTNAFELELLRPQAHALALAQMTPDGVDISHTLCCDGLNGCFARIPLDDQRNLARQSCGLLADLSHDFEGAQV